MMEITATNWSFVSIMKQLLALIPGKDGWPLFENSGASSPRTGKAGPPKQTTTLQPDFSSGGRLNCDDELVELYRAIDLAG